LLIDFLAGLTRSGKRKQKPGKKSAYKTTPPGGKLMKDLPPLEKVRKPPFGEKTPQRMSMWRTLANRPKGLPNLGEHLFWGAKKKPVKGAKKKAPKNLPRREYITRAPKKKRGPH